MTKNKNNQSIWNTRIKKSSSSLFQKVGNSLHIDKRLYKEDISGSIAHVEMLFKQKIISFKVKNKIIYGLNKIAKEISNKKFEFNEKYEDIHMNIEKRLFQIIGDEAGYIHTARSRNDQVITDFKMWIKSATNEINFTIDKVIKSTLKLAEKNIYTIMPGFTHLKNAQAISFAHYLMAYIEIFNRDKKRFENNFENLEENPLGVAGKIELHSLIGKPASSKIEKFVDTNCVTIKHDASLQQAMEAAANFVGEAIPIINRETNQVISVITEGAIFDAYLKVQDTVIDMEKR